MKQRPGTSFEKATLLTRSKICVIVLISTVLVETVFIAYSGQAYVDTFTRSAAANSTSKGGRSVSVKRRTPDMEADAHDFLQLYEFKCSRAAVLRHRQRPKVDELPLATFDRHGNRPSSTCPCAPKTLGFCGSCVKLSIC